MTAIKLKKHMKKRRILFLSLVRKWNRRLRKNSRGVPTRMAIIFPSNGPNGNIRERDTAWVDP